MRKIKRDDEIVVISGKDRGKRGIVLCFRNNKVLISGINKVKKHIKPNPQINQSGGIMEKEAFIAISNVALYNAVSGKPDDVFFQFLENGSKIRVFKSNGDIVGI